MFHRSFIYPYFCIVVLYSKGRKVWKYLEVKKLEPNVGCCPQNKRLPYKQINSIQNFSYNPDRLARGFDASKEYNGWQFLQFGFGHVNRIVKLGLLINFQILRTDKSGLEWSDWLLYQRVSCWVDMSRRKAVQKKSGKKKYLHPISKVTGRPRALSKENPPRTRIGPPKKKSA